MHSKAVIILAAVTLLDAACSAKPLTMELRAVVADGKSRYHCPIVVEKPISDPLRIPKVIQNISCDPTLSRDCVTVTEEVTVFALDGNPYTQRVNVGCVHRSEASNAAYPRRGF